MESLWNFLIDVARRLFLFWRVIYPNQAGVRTLLGKNPSALPCGTHLVWPIIGEIEVINVSEQVLDVRTQSLTTSDGHTVAVGISIAYEIINPVKALYGNFDWDSNLANEALRVTGEYVSGKPFDELLNSEAMNRHIISELRKIATDRWGLKVLRVGRTDYAKHRALRLMGAYREGTNTTAG